MVAVLAACSHCHLYIWGGGENLSLPSGSLDAIQMVPKIANYLVAYMEEIFCLEGRCRFDRAKGSGTE
jgi:hypothetical protein